MLKVTITPYLNVIKKQIKETHELNQKNYGKNANIIMDDMTEEAAIHNAAKAAGITRSQFIREAALKRAAVPVIQRKPKRRVKRKATLPEARHPTPTILALADDVEPPSRRGSTPKSWA